MVDGKVELRHFAKFYPVYGTSEENKKFFASTPSGCLDLQVMRAPQFEVGKEYYLDIIEVPAEEPAKQGLKASANDPGQSPD